MERCGQAFRPWTRDNQHSHALLYVAFTIYFSFRDIPAAPKTLLCYAEFLLRSYRAAKSVTNALSSVRRLHIDLCADQSAFTSPLVESGFLRAQWLQLRVCWTATRSQKILPPCSHYREAQDITRPAPSLAPLPTD